MLGANLTKDGEVTFTVWAPKAQTVEVHLLTDNRYIPMERDDRGYFICRVAGIQAGERYFYRLDGEKERPDPASRSQPDGVHQASAVVDPHYDWQVTNWSPPTLRNSVFYELHVGTFTPEGTFEAIIPHLPRLKSLGITTLELMPIAQFPGERNWGYDGVGLYAPQNSYGGGIGLKRLVDAAHAHGLAVFLDVVYNHLGPEGNYLWNYGYYFTDRYRSSWGDVLNFDGAYSDEVRRFFIENAIYWMRDYHIDGFRLDATHALFDFRAVPFLEELVAAVHDWADQHSRRVYVIAENDRSDRKTVLPRELGGVGLDAQWLDDLHHVIHHALTGEADGYYMDYARFDLIAKVLREGFALSGEYSPHMKRRHGTSSADIPSDRFIVCVQNHDQVGNRMLGERLTHLTDLAGRKLAAGVLLTSPYIPLLFMGEEYGETAPFLYFISHGDAQLVEAVRKGRKAEFAYFNWQADPPDPFAIETFQRSKINHDLRHEGEHAELYAYYKALLKLRRETPALTNPHREDTHVMTQGKIICMERRYGTQIVRIFMNFHLSEPQIFTSEHVGDFYKVFDSTSTAPQSLPQTLTLPPKAFVVYQGNS